MKDNIYKFLNKGISTSVGIIVIVVVAVIAGALMWYLAKSMTEQPIPALPTPSPTADATAGWKIYRNDEYGFELKLPENILVKEQDSKAGKVEFMSKERDTFLACCLSLPTDITNPEWPVLYEAMNITKEECEQDRWMEQCVSGKDTPILYFSLELKNKAASEIAEELDYTIRGQPMGMPVEEPSRLGIETSHNVYHIFYTLENEGQEYIVFETEEGGALLLYHPWTNCFAPGEKGRLTFFNQCEVFYQILSTFSFLE